MALSALLSSQGMLQQLLAPLHLPVAALYSHTQTRAGHPSTMALAFPSSAGSMSLR